MYFIRSNAECLFVTQLETHFFSICLFRYEWIQYNSEKEEMFTINNG